MDPLKLPSAALIVAYISTWLIGMVFQWRVLRRIKALAAEDPGRFDVSQEFLNINSVQRSRWFHGYLWKKKSQAIDDARFHRDCRILKFSFVALLALMAVLGLNTFVLRGGAGAAV